MLQAHLVLSQLFRDPTYWHDPKTFANRHILGASTIFFIYFHLFLVPVVVWVITWKVAWIVVGKHKLSVETGRWKQDAAHDHLAWAFALEEWIHLVDFSPFPPRVTIFVTYCTQSTFWKGVCSIRKEVAASGSLSRRGQNQFWVVILEVDQFS